MTGPCWGYHRGIFRGNSEVHYFDANGESICKIPRRGGHYKLAMPIIGFKPEKHHEMMCPRCRLAYIQEMSEEEIAEEVPKPI